MAIVSLIFFSGGGATALLADAITEGAGSIEGVTVNMLRIEGGQIDQGRW